MSTDYINVKNSKVHQALYNFVNLEVLPNLKISEKEFWNIFIESANELSPENRKLLKKRDEIQKKLDDWYKLKNSKINLEEYKKFLHEIDYLVEEKEDFKIETSDVDDEIAKIAERYGAHVPFKRPKSLSDDFTGTIPVIKHAISWVNKNISKVVT